MYEWSGRGGWLIATAMFAGACLGCAAEPTSIPPASETPLPKARGAVHRLNRAEYNATVADVLGTKLEPASASWREGELLGFDNMAAVLSVDEQQYERYFAAAKSLAADVMGSAELRGRFIDCDLSRPDCTEASLERAGLALFRRALTADERGVYSRLDARARELGDTPVAAFQLALTALLSSAQFLYRIELEPAAPTRDARELGAFDLASRLSYFLWSSAPDAELLATAASGTLLDESTLSTTVERLLDDPKASRFVDRFAGQWLGAQRVAAHAAAPELYNWTPQVAQAAGDEMIRYFAEQVSSDRPWPDFLKADVNYVTEPLARYYGIPTPTEPVARVEHLTDDRAGFLGLGGFLALSSFDRRTSPSLRGRWIAGNLLCAEPPAPPANVPKLGGSAEGSAEPVNVRQTLELHRRDPACASCHALFDAYGLALEAYDAVGQFRSSYADGAAIDTTATLPPSEAHPEGLTFVGLAGLSDAVAADPRFGDCLAQKLLTYGLGRELEGSDTAALTGAVERWRAPGEVQSVRRLLKELVLSEAFRFHLPEPTP